MTLPKHSHFTRCGLGGIDSVPFGMHACHFYGNRGELVAALVPYFVAGLSGNERCLWVTAPPLPAIEAVQALRAESDGVDTAVQAGALRVFDFDEWYGNSTRLKGLDVVQLWLEEEERALADGYSGLRITGNTSFLAPDHCSTFMDCEQAVTKQFNGRRIVALCSYALSQFDDQHIAELCTCTTARSSVPTPTGRWSRSLNFRPMGAEIWAHCRAERESLLVENVLLFAANTRKRRSNWRTPRIQIEKRNTNASLRAGTRSRRS